MITWQICALTLRSDFGETELCCGQDEEFQRRSFSAIKYDMAGCDESHAVALCVTVGWTGLLSSSPTKFILL